MQMDLKFALELARSAMSCSFPASKTGKALQGITNIQDEGLEHVAALKALRQLDHAHCWRITDSGIHYLLRLPYLAHLDIAYCWQVRGTVAQPDIVTIASFTFTKRAPSPFLTLHLPDRQGTISQMWQNPWLHLRLHAIPLG